VEGRGYGKVGQPGMTVAVIVKMVWKCCSSEWQRPDRLRRVTYGANEAEEM